MNTQRFKYPRTYHLSWSKSVHDDDKIISSLAPFVGQRVVVTEKMDGENTTLYSDYIHARSLDSRHHPSRDWVKQFWGQICHNIPHGWRICGENLFAKHSIFYDNLSSYFMGFSIWNEQNICLDWDSTLIWFNKLGISPVPVIYDGLFNEKQLQRLERELDFSKQEGYVIRLASAIAYQDFSQQVAKYVRHKHLQTDDTWLKQSAIVSNKLAKSA